jgi:Rad3-related DNA helicase
LTALKALAEWISKNNEDLFSEDTSQYIPSFFGCDAPTGIGKSYIAICLAKYINAKTRNQVWIVTASKLLQDQYEKDFPKDIFLLKGISNYQCNYDPGKTCDASKCGRVKAPEGAERPFFPKYCERKCEYDSAVGLAKIAPVVMLNAAKALNIIKAYKGAWLPQILIYDEGHGIESQLDNESSMTIKPEELEKIGLQFDDYFEKPQMDQAPNMDGLLALRDAAENIFLVQTSAPLDLRDIRKLKKSEAIVRKIDEVIENIDELQIRYVNASDEFIDLRPLKIFSVFKKFMQVPTVFLSATLLSKEGFCSTIGVPPEEMGWVSLDSPFPVENRKIVNGFGMGARPLNYQNQEAETANVLERIRDILRKHSDQRGIIHTHTYKWALKIAELDREREFRGRILYPRSAAEQKEILVRHAESRNTVLLSPSMTEGVDLKEDLARFCLLVKVPYLPLTDPVVKARMEDDPTWYGYRSLMTFIQACGRGVRSSEDYCLTYLVDPGFMGFINRNKRLFPPWFLAAYEKGKYHGRC